MAWHEEFEDAQGVRLCRSAGAVFSMDTTGHSIDPRAAARSSQKNLQSARIPSSLRHKVDADHVEAHRRRGLLGQLAHVLPGQPAQDLALVRSRRRLRLGWRRGRCASSPRQSRAAAPARRSGRCRRARRLTTSAAPPRRSPCGADRRRLRLRPQCQLPDGQAGSRPGPRRATRSSPASARSSHAIRICCQPSHRKPFSA